MIIIMIIIMCGYPTTSTIDWYGKSSLIFHFSGCNFNCKYCQNSDYIDGSKGIGMTNKYIRNILLHNKDFIDSVVISGGEPTVQEDGLSWLCREAHELGYDVMVDTNGSNVDLIMNLVREGYIDRVALDVKAPLDGSYYEVITKGINIVTRVKVLLRGLGRSDTELEVRTTVVEDTACSSDKLFTIAESIKDYVDEYHIQQFDSEHGYIWKDKPEPEYNDLIDIGKAIHRAYDIPVIVKRNTGERAHFV